MAIPGFDPDAAARQVGLEFLTGYIVEKSLAVDNIFVFVVVFGFLRGAGKVPAPRPVLRHPRGARLPRDLHRDGLGPDAVSLVVIVFGAFLILTGVKMFFAPEKPIDPERNPVIRLFKRLMPVTPQLHGQRFFVRQSGRMHATPLFVALLFLELSDIIFAVDSVPAIFALTREPSSSSRRTSSPSSGCGRCTSCSPAPWTSSTC